MAVDEALFLGDGPPTLRLYRWNPHGVSLGYFQKYTDLPTGPLAADGVPVVRRLTGGGAIYHGDEITFSITCSSDHELFRGIVRESYDRVHAVLSRAIGRCLPAARNVAPRGDQPLLSDSNASPWCFHESTAFDLVSSGRKLVGSAQRRSRGRILHHGSIVLRPNRYTTGIASIEELGGNPDPAALERALVLEFVTAIHAEFEMSDLTPPERELATRLAHDKYASDSWNRRT
jgi:lipoate-protein ligase A